MRVEFSLTFVFQLDNLVIFVIRVLGDGVGQKEKLILDSFVVHADVMNAGIAWRHLDSQASHLIKAPSLPLC
jgi:hypothetical protein